MMETIYTYNGIYGAGAYGTRNWFRLNLATRWPHWYREAMARVEGGEQMTLPQFIEASLDKNLIALDADSDISMRLLPSGEAVAINDWTLRRYGIASSSMTGTLAEAIEAVTRGISREDYPPSNGTLWIDWEVACEASGTALRGAVALEPTRPSCVDYDTEHRWIRPFPLVGGSVGNPGVTLKSEGMLYREVCPHCGRYRITDTGSTRPDTDERGLTTVRYEEPNAASLAWLCAELSLSIIDLDDGVTHGSDLPAKAVALPFKRKCANRTEVDQLLIDDHSVWYFQAGADPGVHNVPGGRARRTTDARVYQIAEAIVEIAQTINLNDH